LRFDRVEMKASWFLRVVATLVALCLGLAAEARSHPGDTVLVDFDDTLVRTEELFLRAKAQFVDIARSIGVDRERALEALDRHDKEVLRQKGFSRSIGDSMRVAISSLGGDQHLAERAQQIGDEVFATRAAQFPNAKETLQRLRLSGMRLVLVTKGNAEQQLRRIHASGIGDHVDLIEIVPDKSAATHRQLFTKLGTTAEHTWVLSNSFPEDIRPALTAGVRPEHAVWIYGRKVWDRDKEPPPRELHIQAARSLRQAAAWILKPTQARR
jgi:putative hydrolase of the HAD superfamily